MLNAVVARGNAALRSVINPAERWRYPLAALRKSIDKGWWNRTSGTWLGGVLTTALLRAMSRYPAAVAPIFRELRRTERKQKALDTVESAWDSNASTSAEWSLACAQAWYENKTMWRGDIALAQAMDLAPDWVTLYELQASNRSERGHMALAVEAAQRVIELRSNPEATRRWSAFIGSELFKAHQYADALSYLERGEPELPHWVYWYERAVCNHHTGHFAEAERCFSRAGDLRVPQLPHELRTPSLHYYQGQFSEAAALLIQEPADPAQDRGEHLALLGRTLLRLERADEAVRYFRARRRENDTADIAKIAALAEELAGNPTEAISEYRSAIDHHNLALQHRLARAQHAAGLIDDAVATWLSITEPNDELRNLDQEPDPNFTNLSRTTVSLPDAGLTTHLPTLTRLAASASSEQNVSRIYRKLGRTLAALGDETGALRAFMRAAPELLPHPSETAPNFAPLGPFERYAAAYETLPLETDVVLYESFHGVRTGCSPLALCQHLLNERPGLRHVWAITNDAVIHPSLRNHPKVSFVLVNSEGYRLHLATAGYLINNNTFPRHYVRREGQRYLNTWHGIPWKTLGRDISGDPYFYDNIARNLLQASHLAFPDDHTTRVMLGTQAISDISTAHVTIAGQPRMDNTLALSDAAQNSLRRRLGVRKNEQTILYAPTWRGANGAIDAPIKPYKDAISALARVQNSKIVLRLHYLISSRLDFDDLPTNVLVAPEEIDTNELLAVTDILVSDYSSLIFDFAPLNRPIIKYVYDLDSYTADRGLYFSMEEVPGVNCRTESELIHETQRAALHPELHDWSASPTRGTWKNEDGHATERVAAAFFADDHQQRTQQRDHDRVLVAMGSLNPNGITRSLRNLIASDPETAQHVQLMIPRGMLNNHLGHDAAEEFRTSIDISPTVHQRVYTRRENLAWDRLQAANQPIDGKLREVLSARMQRDRRRLFGEVKFSAAVDFDGYNLHHSVLIALGFPASTKTVYTLHNDFEQEWRLKYPNLGSTGLILSNFDVLASVSDPTRELNQTNLERDFSTPADLHFTMLNTINIASIRAQGAEPLDKDLQEWLAHPGPHAVVVGRLSLEKNHSALLEAFAGMDRPKHEQPNLTFLGDGPRRLHLMRQAQELGVADRVLFAGHRRNPYPMMQHADVLLLPSLHEGLPMVLLEAMTLGTPVVSTRIPGPASLLRDGEFGLLVEPTPEGLCEALRAIADDALVTPGAFDPHAHQRMAIDAFRRAIGREPVHLGLPVNDSSP